MQSWLVWLSGAIPSQMVSIPSGKAGIPATLRIMAQMAQDGSRTVAVRDAALRVIRAAGIAPHDYVGELRALFEWVRDRVRFVGDPVGIETLQDATRTLAWMQGDCDDMSILLAALVQTIGHPARLLFRAITPGGEGHVYVVAITPQGREIGMDPIYPRTAFGWQHPNQSGREDFPLWAT